MGRSRAVHGVCANCGNGIQPIGRPKSRFEKSQNDQSTSATGIAFTAGGMVFFLSECNGIFCVFFPFLSESMAGAFIHPGFAVSLFLFLFQTVYGSGTFLVGNFFNACASSSLDCTARTT